MHGCLNKFDIPREQLIAPASGTFLVTFEELVSLQEGTIESAEIAFIGCIEPRDEAI